MDQMFEDTCSDAERACVRRVVTVSSGVVVAVGISGLAGWLFDIPTLRSVDAGMTPMMPLTGVCLLVAGVALWSARRSRTGRWLRPLAFGCAAAIGLAGAMTLSEYVLDWDWGIDRLVLSDRLPHSGLRYPGRMAPEGATNFLLAGVGVALATFDRGAAIVQWIAIAIFVVASVALATNVCDLQTLNAIRPFTTNSIHTALAFFCLSAGILCLDPDKGVAAVILRNPANVGCAVGMLTLLGIAAGAFFYTQRLIGTSRWVEQTHRVKDSLTDLWSSMQEMESAARGFVITGDETFLEPVDRSASNARERLAELTSMTADDADERAAMERLAALGLRRLALSNERITVRKEQGTNAASTLVSTAAGRRLMDEAHQLIDTMTGAQSRLLRARQDEVERSTANAVFALSSAGALSVSVLAVAFYVLRREIGQRRRATLALAVSEHGHRFLTDAMPQIVWTARPEGGVNYYNARWYSYTGMTFEQTKEWGWQTVVHPDDLPGCMERWTASIRSARVMDGEFRFKRVDGAYRWMLSRGEMQVDATGKAARWVGTYTDIHDQKLAEQRIGKLNIALKERAGQLQSANQELEAFSYSVSHDLRAPLRSIDGFSQALLEDAAGTLDEGAQGHLRRIRGATARMSQLIDDLLELSRVSRTQMKCQPVDVTEMARTVVSGLEASDGGHRPEVIVAEGMSARGDAQLLRIVLENLIGNAWKFTARTADARIVIGESKLNGTGTFFVRDNGAGFDMAFADKLFGAFQRLHAATEFAGTGIGLATVQRIIRRHRGRVWADGEVGIGAEFHFTIGTDGAAPEASSGEGELPETVAIQNTFPRES